LEFKKAEAKLV